MKLSESYVWTDVGFKKEKKKITKNNEKYPEADYVIGLMVVFLFRCPGFSSFDAS